MTFLPHLGERANGFIRNRSLLSYANPELQALVIVDFCLDAGYAFRLFHFLVRWNVFS